MNIRSVPIVNHAKLLNIGNNTHAQIDSHIASTSNPHGVTLTQVGGTLDHNALNNLTVGDVHTHYALLAGRAGGQTLSGGTGAGENLTLQSTSHPTKSKILFGTSAYNEADNRLGIGTTSPSYTFHIKNIGGNSLFSVSSTGQVASGEDSTASGNVSFAEGVQALASGHYSIALGYLVSATSVHSKSLGFYLNCSGDNSILLGKGIDNGNRLVNTVNNSFMVAFNSTIPTLFVSGGSGVGTYGNVGIAATVYGTSAAGVLSIGNGTAPSTSPANIFQMYSADIAVGNAAPHFRTENGAVIKLYQQAAIAAADGTLADITTKFNTLLSYLENSGLMAA